MYLVRQNTAYVVRKLDRYVAFKEVSSKQGEMRVPQYWMYLVRQKTAYVLEEN
jgi:hypothetical protein